MVTKSFSLTILLIISMASIFSTCKKGGLGCADTVYSFQIGVKAYPDKDSIKTGDTLWMEVNAPSSLTDIASNKIINYGGAENLGSAIAFEKIVSASNFQNSTNSFSYILINGKEISSSNLDLTKEYLFSEQNDNYLFKLGIIPKEKGVFAIVFSSATNVYRKSDKCTKASFIINFEGTNQHYYLNPNFQPGTSPVGGDYYFKVF